MAATVSTRELNGAGPTPTTVTTIYHQTVDQSAQDNTNILMRPLAGSNYSYWKTIYLNCVTTPVTQINNVKFWSDGAIGWTDITYNIGDETPVIGSYDQATGTAGSTGDEVVANHAAITGVTDIETYAAEGSAKTITGSIANPNVGQISSLVILQLTIGTSAVAGTLSSETLTWGYDET
jgi:hypothetical protein